MAQEKRNTTRFSERVSQRIGSSIRFLKEVGLSLLGIEREDGLAERGVKSASWATKFAAYAWMDSTLNAMQFSIAVAMKALGFSFLSLFLVLWAYDFVVAGVFVLIHETTGKDFTLGVDYRRAMETMKRRSSLLGLLMLIWVSVRALVWTGPEKVIAFFRAEIGSTKGAILVLTGLTCFQSFIWAALYSYAFDFVMKYL